ncbi:hypothetical protein Tco_0317168 [Tanacetum coccineum]
MSSTLSAPTLQETPADVSDPDPMSYAKLQSIPEREIPSSPNSIYQPGWGMTNSCRLESPDVCQDMVDHIVPLGYFSELRHMRNEDFLNQYNMNLAWQVVMGSQLRLRFEQEVRLLKRTTEKVAKRDQRIQAREEEIKKLDQEIHSLKSTDTELQGLRDERIKAAFEEIKRYEDDKVELRCAEMDARLDKLSIDFDEELYPHMLTGIAGRRWLIGHGLRLAVLKCAESPEISQAFPDVVSAGLAKGMSEGLQYGIEHGKSGRDLGDVEAYDPEDNDKFVKALQDLKYPIVDQLERLKDSLIDLIMASGNEYLRKGRKIKLNRTKLSAELERA